MNNIINNFFYSNLKKYILTGTNDSGTDNLVLEPFTTIIRLALLKYKQKYTKISIFNNKIFYQEPDILQPALRWKNGDTREHIHNLYNPIIKFTQWYNMNDEKFIYILNIAKDGLENLEKCYNTSTSGSSTIIHLFNFYNIIINNIVLKPNELISTNLQYDNNNQSDVNSLSMINNSYNIHNLETSDIYYRKFRTLWSENLINIIYLILNELETVEESNQEEIISLISSIEKILDYKDSLVCNIVKKYSTSL